MHTRARLQPSFVYAQRHRALTAKRIVYCRRCCNPFVLGMHLKHAVLARCTDRRPVAWASRASSVLRRAQTGIALVDVPAKAPWNHDGRPGGAWLAHLGDTHFA